MPLYRTYGREEDLHIELFDCAHQELPEMRELILKWMDRTWLRLNRIWAARQAKEPIEDES